ncbi:hypothetical protein NGM99_12595 [Mesorhizobium sp. RP14(2022)]|uniref:Uncharacterized protein n=1 Tax=Mesorhizobium liriopis TaxID=2953882 RepID=A0ABT1C723_9HYPH|nr:hypothetical protein [Mesorhizobium liriopis]MCO6050622.1 hypothetical protein [Mesorhizobium liriopis]
MTDEVAGLEDEAKHLRAIIANCEAATRTEARATSKVRSDGSLMAFRNRLMVVELRIKKIKFRPLRLVE